MSDYNRPPGTTTVAPGVLMTIARMAAAGVPGVASVGLPVDTRSRSWRRRAPSTVRLTVQDGSISGDIHLVIKSGVNVRDVCREAQQHVARALQEMAGMPVARLDVHVEDIAYDSVEA